MVTLLLQLLSAQDGGNREQRDRRCYDNEMVKALHALASSSLGFALYGYLARICR